MQDQLPDFLELTVRLEWYSIKCMNVLVMMYTLNKFKEQQTCFQRQHVIANLRCQLGWATLCRYLVKCYSRGFCEGISQMGLTFK